MSVSHNTTMETVQKESCIGQLITNYHHHLPAITSYLITVHSVKQAFEHFVEKLLFC